MPIFISYSHQDAEFVDKLADQLVQNRVSVWLDKWELKAGDSLIAKIGEAITGASALLVILSKASVKSEWCKKELNVAMTRELAEKKVIVVPVLIEKCKIPPFLTDKKYANFTKSYDQGLSEVLEAVAGVTNVYQGKIDTPKFHTDWSVDWWAPDADPLLRLTMIDHYKGNPTTILTETAISGISNDARKWWWRLVVSGRREDAIEEVLLGLAAAAKGDEDLTVNLSNQLEKPIELFFDAGTEPFVANITVRRLGMDNGQAVLIRLDGQLANVANSVEGIRSKPGKASPRKAPKRVRPRTVIPKAKRR